MKKMLIALLTLAVSAIAVNAEHYYWPVAGIATTTTVTSADLPVSGELDRVILWNSVNTQTSVVTIASYAGTSIADVIYTGKVSAAAIVVARPRRVGTDSAGTALTAAQIAGSTDTNLVSTILYVPYEKILLSGNIKIRVVDESTASATNTLHAQFLYTK